MAHSEYLAISILNVAVYPDGIVVSAHDAATNHGFRDKSWLSHSFTLGAAKPVGNLAV